MKRSEINTAIRKAKIALSEIQFALPQFAYWSLEEWKEHKDWISGMVEVMQGWDVTDFGSDQFDQIGAVLFTVRNGNLHNLQVGVPYCEKIIVFNDEEKQVIPLHFHKNKTEDIINRGNGVMEIELFQSTNEAKVDANSPVEVFMDGIKYTFAPGEVIEILPGNSITLTPGLYHRFGSKKGAGALVAGEISKINDDNTDNIFAEEQKRFSVIDEDELPLYPLCNEYIKLLK